MSVSMAKLQEMLAKARAAKNVDNSVADALQNVITDAKPEVISFSGAGLSDEQLKTDAGEEAAVEILTEMISNDHTQVSSITPNDTNNSPGEGKIGSGVSRKVTLNSQQLLFQDTILSGKDCCLIGSAGTGKTTCTGAAFRSLIDSEQIGPLGEGTKWLAGSAPGILICSYTRKAVNNIRRAVPEELKGNTLTLHKVLEFAPVFYEIEDLSNPGKFKKTMNFEPKRNRLNPLPEGLKLIAFEESSMIGTDLYNMLKEATPHLPQEIFIGDIQQLPPIFGSAILGFKMALLPIVELKEVYRQALESPIIRLAQAILSGDPYKFDKSVKTREEKHPDLNRTMVRKYVPSLESFDCDDNHGLLKFQIWQKAQDPEISCYATIQQFIAWSKKGYYNEKEDIILCPFNKGFGTLAINRGLLEYFGRQRQAVVYEIIAGFNKHYYAEGDRVLYDKEDAVIVSIKRNTGYLGKAPLAASVDLNREGSYIKELSEEEQLKNNDQEALLANQALEDFFLDDFSTDNGEDDGEGRVQIASHAITIRYSYSDDEVELRSAAEINNLLGGHALTVHKMQGSEAESIFIVLHKSHAVMVQRELLYTAVTRARTKLHIICEYDTFFNGVKSQKVKGTTLEEKMVTFRGKANFVEMEEEMKLLKYQQEAKAKKLQATLAQKQLKTTGDTSPVTSSLPAPILFEDEKKPMSLAERIAFLKQQKS